MGEQTWNKSPDKCLIKCLVVMGARKRAGSSLGEQRGKEVSSGRGPPGKEARLPGQRRGGVGREVKLPGSKIPWGPGSISGASWSSCPSTPPFPQELLGVAVML